MAAEDAGDDGAGDDGGGSQRIDKWLWYTRAIKSRTLAAGLVTDGKVRVNAQRTNKPSHALKPGDVITVNVRGHIRVLKVIAPGVRRGPPTEAQSLYEEISNHPPAGPTKGSGASPGVRDAGQGRPTKRERRDTDRLRDPER